jgi:MscS family membrane protein
MFDFFNKTFLYDTSLTQWLISLGIIIIVILLKRIIQWIFRNVFVKIASKTKTTYDNVIIEKSQNPIVYGIIIFGIWKALKIFIFTPETSLYIDNSYRILFIINLTWLFARVFDGVIKEYMNNSIDNKNKKFNYSLVHTVQKAVNVFVWCVGIVVTLKYIGVNIATLLTGLGIGGIAIALASQDTIKNIFAGVVLFTDRPFRVGDRVLIDGIDGIVEDIGMRSVRIRTLNKRLVTISCSKVIDSVIENITSEPTRRVTLLLGLTYDTTPDKMQIALDILKSLPNFVPEIKREIYVYFNNYTDFALQITLNYHIRGNANIYDTQSKVNLKILSLFNENGLEFAYPTQTVILKK